MEVQQRWMTVEQVAKYLQVSRPTLYEWMRTGRLPYRELPGGRGRRFDRSEVDRLLAEPVPKGEALIEAIRKLHHDMNLRWHGSNDEFQQVIHLLREAASRTSLVAARPGYHVRRAETSCAADMEALLMVRQAGRLLRAYMAERETRVGGEEA